MRSVWIELVLAISDLLLVVDDLLGGWVDLWVKWVQSIFIDFLLVLELSDPIIFSLLEIDLVIHELINGPDLIGVDMLVRVPVSLFDGIVLLENLLLSLLLSLDIVFLMSIVVEFISDSEFLPLSLFFREPLYNKKFEIKIIIRNRKITMTSRVIS